MFGRRKGGFSREEEVDEFSEEYNEDVAREQEEELLKEEKVDIMDLLNEDVDDEDIEEFIEFVDNRTEAEMMGDFIRERSLASHLTSKSHLEEDEKFEEIFEELINDESYSDIKEIEGKEDTYIYSDKYMSDNYAMIAMLVADKDLSRIIAEMVRWNAKTYPCSTPLYYFKSSPYFYSEEELNAAIKNMGGDDRYLDIQELTTKNNKRYLYSTEHLSEKYARALANSAEQSEGGYYL